MELSERMKMTRPGQLTWADPDKGAKCLTCSSVVKLPKAAKTGEYKCGMVFIHTKRHGVPFDAARAIACSKYERKVTAR